MEPECHSGKSARLKRIRSFLCFIKVDFKNHFFDKWEDKMVLRAYATQ